MLIFRQGQKTELSNVEKADTGQSNLQQCLSTAFLRFASKCLSAFVRPRGANLRWVAQRSIWSLVDYKLVRASPTTDWTVLNRVTTRTANQPASCMPTSSKFFGGISMRRILGRIDYECGLCIGTSVLQPLVDSSFHIILLPYEAQQGHNMLKG